MINSDQKIEVFDGLLHDLYASIEVKGFDNFLAAMRNEFGLVSACLVVIDEPRQKALYGFASGYPKGLIPILLKTNGVVKEDGVVRAIAHGPSCVLRYSEGDPNYNILKGLSFFTQKWVKASGIFDAAIISFMLNQSQRVVIILNRHERAGIFQTEDMLLLKRLKPHIESACALYNRFCRDSKKVAGIQEIVTHLDYPVAIFSPLHEVISFSGEFKSVGELYHLWQLDGGQFSCFDDEVSRRIIDCCFCTKMEQEGVFSPQILFLPTDKLPLRLTFKALVSERFSDALVMLEIHDPNRQPNLKLNHIGASLEVSPAEANVCLSLVNGLDAQAIAETHSLSIHTVRSHIKNVLRRNEMSRQTELVIKLVDLELSLTKS